MRRAGRVDANQPDIVRDLRQCGCSVAITSAVGDGFVDIVVGFRGINVLLEIKDGDKPPSKRKLTPAEADFHRDWKGQIAVVKSFDEAWAVVVLGV